MSSMQEVQDMLGKSDLEFVHWAGRVGLCADPGQRRICGRCGSIMHVVISHSLRDGAVFRCSNGYCATQLSVRVDWWTWDMRLTLRQIALLFAYWVDRRPVRMAVTDVRACKRTVIDYYDFFRGLAEIAYRRDLAKNPIGGTYLGVVEVDESLFNRAKYHRGAALARPQMWFFGAVDTATNRLAVEACPDRSAATLEAMISGMVAPKSEIWSDCWRGYNGLDDLGFLHMRVNHEEEYKDPITGINTNRIEGNWGAIKEFLRQNHVKSRDKTESYIHEYCFRRNVGRTFESCWKAIIATQEATRNQS